MRSLNEEAHVLVGNGIHVDESLQVDAIGLGDDGVTEEGRVAGACVDDVGVELAHNDDSVAVAVLLD